MIAARLMLMVFACWAAVASAQEFSVSDAHGRTHRLADYRGKWVLVNFWATWCPPCLEEMPDLGALYDERRQRDLVVIGIAMHYRNPAEVIEFADNMLVSYPIVLGEANVTQQFAPVTVLPTTLIYDPAGKLVKTHVGAITRRQIEAFLGAPR
ncbi:MAG TPA: TlpA disulfide reductase family protein [Burkholderiales bacterium]|nr:TlpA disulfide reductase family protein [Burkholderiales bacterium]